MSAGHSEAPGWRLQVALERTAFEALEGALENLTDAVVAETVKATHPIEKSPADLLRVTLFGTDPAGEDSRPKRLLALLGEAGVELDDAAVEPEGATDWLAQSAASFPPVTIGRLTIVGAHQDPPSRRFVLRVDAGPAFGSGRHETTQGCLLALDWLARQRQVRTAFDIGTGSGILAVAAARLWPARVLALDSDPVAVATARKTLRQNGLSRRVTVVQGEGFHPIKAMRLGGAGLIVANIRVKPIAAMAAAFARHLEPRGGAVLSGLLASEERLVLAAFRAVGLRLRRRMGRGAWVTLILTR